MIRVEELAPEIQVFVISLSLCIDLSFIRSLRKGNLKGTIESVLKSLVVTHMDAKDKNCE
jgi:hypothetical protein